MENFEILESYLKNELNDHERASFESRLKSDKKLQIELKALTDINSYLEYESLDKVELREEISRMLSDTEFKSRRKTLIYRTTSVAAVLLIIIGISVIYKLFFSGLSGNEVFQKYYKPYQFENEIRSDDTNDDNIDFLKGVEFYQNHEYVSAKPFLKLSIKNQNNQRAKILMAICYLETSDYSNSINILNELLTTDKLYFETASWYLALCHLKINNNEKAKSIFQELASYHNYYSENAKQILKTLK